MLPPCCLSLTEVISDKRVAPILQNYPELERMLFEGAGVTSGDQFVAALGQKPLGEFVHQLVGLDVQAAKSPFSAFLYAGDLSAAQIEFVDMLINYLVENGMIEKKVLYRQPFPDIDGQGILSLAPDRKEHLFRVVEGINRNASASA